jgi:S1-C subfamily serine protease
MSKIPACVLAIAILFSSCSADDEPSTVAGAAAPPAADVAALANKVGDAVWRVDTEGCGWLGSGSAFAIDRRHLVTNHHVTANDTSPVVRSREGKRLQGRVIGA